MHLIARFSANSRQMGRPWCYGVPVRKGVTFANIIGESGHLLDGIVDINPNKQGKVCGRVRFTRVEAGGACSRHCARKPYC